MSTKQGKIGGKRFHGDPVRFESLAKIHLLDKFNVKYKRVEFAFAGPKKYWFGYRTTRK